MTNHGPRPEFSLQDLDFSTVCFPSDDISIKRLRELHPDLFDSGYASGAHAQPTYLLRPEEAGHVTDLLGNMLYLERWLVAWSFATAHCMEPPEGERAAFLEELTSLYQKYGIAQGPHHASQLIRSLETSGRQLGHSLGD